MCSKRATAVDTRRALTEVEERVLTFIVDYIEERKYPPTVREIADGVGRGTSAVHATLQRLRKKGWLEIDGGPRMLRVVE